MNAVNLIPADERRRRNSVATGLPFIGLLGGLVVILIATVVFVIAHNRVDSKQSQLAAVQARVTRLSAAAASYSSAVATAQKRQTTISTVESLVDQRANWSEVLGQLAAVMPAHTQISSLTASAPAPAGSTGSTTAGTAASPTASPAAATTAATPGSPSTGSPIQLAACAASQSIVAQTMVNLRRISGVSNVYLASSGTSSPSGSGSSGSCSYPVSFSVSLAFTAPTTSGSGDTSQPTSDPSSTQGSSGVSQ